MAAGERVVVDTNVLVSRLILPQSVPAQALRRGELEAHLLVSEATMYELADVLARPKFDLYVELEDRQQFIRQLSGIVEFVPIIQIVHECRDPRDDKFLELALNGRADVIITGDEDLLELHPWREIAILSPVGYLKRF
ncbi:MAG TPA: putative toxin-antitoxin system toxin component, PIN family [Terriglobales bacterium]|jgi:putative PIN family toxin of toxin-antitoxin system|nr:putative toxin-antitoxin system toxin component, PIN family [Terriglobales bacterium]